MNVDLPQAGLAGAASSTSISSSNCVPNSASANSSSIPGVGSTNGVWSVSSVQPFSLSDCCLNPFNVRKRNVFASYDVYSLLLYKVKSIVILVVYFICVTLACVWTSVVLLSPYSFHLGCHGNPIIRLFCIKRRISALWNRQWRCKARRLNYTSGWLPDAVGGLHPHSEFIHDSCMYFGEWWSIVKCTVNRVSWF